LLLAACNAGPQVLPAAFTGVFHLDGAVDETALGLDAGGGFRWSIWGCDFCGGDGGRWTVDGNIVTLQPADGRSTMDWDTGVGFKDAVAAVRLSDAGGKLNASGMLVADQSSFTQTWSSGRVCTTCSGRGSGPLAPCQMASPRFDSCPAPP